MYPEPQYHLASGPAAAASVHPMMPSPAQVSPPHMRAFQFSRGMPPHPTVPVMPYHRAQMPASPVWAAAGARVPYVALESAETHGVGYSGVAPGSFKHQAYPAHYQPQLHHPVHGYNPRERQMQLSPRGQYPGVVYEREYEHLGRPYDARTFSGLSPTLGAVDDRAQVMPPLQRHKGRRMRRRYYQIYRKYKCLYPECTKSYGSLNHLNTHIVTKKHGQRKSKADFKDLDSKSDDALPILPTARPRSHLDHAPPAAAPPTGSPGLPRGSVSGSTSLASAELHHSSGAAPEQPEQRTRLPSLPSVVGLCLQ